MERTLVILKPDAVQRQLVGRIISRFESKGLRIVGMKMLRLSPDAAAVMYAEHAGKEFCERLVAFMTCGPIVAIALEGNGAIAVARKMLGPTFGPDAPPGTIRGDFGLSKRYNLIHGSDSPAAAMREIPIFFANGELMSYDLADEQWIYDKTGPSII